MQTRPFFLPFFTILLGLITLIFPIQLMVYYEHFLRTSPFTHALLTYVIITFALANAFWLYNASPTVKWSLPSLSVTMSLYLYFLYNAEIITSLEIMISGLIIFFSVNLVFLDSQSKFIINHPNLRWWRIEQRKPIKIPAFISPFRGEGFSSTTFDLSAHGAFFPHSSSSPSSALDDHEEHLKAGSPLTIRLSLGPLRTIRLKAKIVRNEAEVLGEYPGGFAVYFTEIDRKSQKYLKQRLKDDE